MSQEPNVVLKRRREAKFLILIKSGGSRDYVTSDALGVVHPLLYLSPCPVMVYVDCIFSGRYLV